MIRHVEGHRLPLAEIDGAKSERVAALAELFSRAGFKSPVLTDVRTEIWMKLWGNLTFNPISALARATLEDICRFAPTRALAVAMMREAQTVGEAFGIRFRLSIDKRIAGAEGIGAHKTSMLQDIEQGRAIEIDALLGSVIELARLAKVRNAASRRGLCGDQASRRDCRPEGAAALARLPHKGGGRPPARGLSLARSAI